jgi:hypothetical protein
MDDEGIVLRDVSAYTLPEMVQITNQTTVDASNLILLQITGNYAYTSIQRNNDWLTTHFATGSNFTDVSGLTPNTDYTYTLIPYNPQDQSGQSIQYTTCTYPYIQDVSFSPGATTFSLIVDGAYSYTTVTIYDADTLNKVFDSSAATVTTPFSGLVSNHTYVLDITPYNSHHQAGQMISQYSLVTLGGIDTVVVQPTSSTNITIDISGSATYYVFQAQASRNLLARLGLDKVYMTSTVDISTATVAWNDPTMDIQADPYNYFGGSAATVHPKYITASTTTTRSIAFELQLSGPPPYVISNLLPCIHLPSFHTMHPASPTPTVRIIFKSIHCRHSIPCNTKT